MKNGHLNFSLSMLCFLMIINFIGCQQKVPDGMVMIPEGSFEMGGRSKDAYANEFPRHQVKVDAFYLDKTEVTNADFKTFVEATGYVTTAEKDFAIEELDTVIAAGSLVFAPDKGIPVNYQLENWWKWQVGANWKHPEGPQSNLDGRWDHPVVHISWDDAQAFADWKGKRLPTEAEWEWAASGGSSENKYPWGTSLGAQANYWQGVFPIQNNLLDGYFGTAPVAHFEPNPFGLSDMAGNVWEWCADAYNVNTYDQQRGSGVVQNPKQLVAFDPMEPNMIKHVIRGGSFLCSDAYCSGYRITRRSSASHDSGFAHVGFRCAMDIEY